MKSETRNVVQVRDLVNQDLGLGVKGREVYIGIWRRRRAVMSRHYRRVVFGAGDPALSEMIVILR